MAKVQINLNNRVYPVECQDSEVELLQKAAEKVSKRFEDLKKFSPSATTEYLLLLCSISLQSDILSSSNDSNDNNNVDKLEYELKEILKIVQDLKFNITN